jgi:hypothetical protein
VVYPPVYVPYAFIECQVAHQHKIWTPFTLFVFEKLDQKPPNVFHLDFRYGNKGM